MTVTQKQRWYIVCDGRPHNSGAGCRPCPIKETDPRHGHVDSVFCTLRCRDHGKGAAGRAGDLFAYMSTIAKASLKYKWPLWIVYDQNFRQEAADKGLKNWAQVDPSIYTQCFTGMTITQEGWCKICLSIDHSSESCSLKQARKRPAATPIASSSKRAQYEPN